MYSEDKFTKSWDHTSYASKVVPMTLPENIWIDSKTREMLEEVFGVSFNTLDDFRKFLETKYDKNKWRINEQTKTV